MPGSDIEFTLYKTILSALCEPATITAIGGVLVAFGSGLFRVMKVGIKSFLGWLYKLSGGTVDAEPEVPRRVHTITPQQVKENSEIVDMMEKLCLKLNCSRVCVLQYHNGEHFSMSNPMFKLSTTYEVLSPGFACTSSTLKNISVSTIPELMNALYLPNMPIISGVKEEKFCSKGGVCELRDAAMRLVSFTCDSLKLGSFRLNMETYGIAKIYACSLTAQNGGLLGVLTIHYHNSDFADESIKEHICEVCKLQQYLQVILYKK